MASASGSTSYSHPRRWTWHRVWTAGGKGTRGEEVQGGDKDGARRARERHRGGRRRLQGAEQTQQGRVVGGKKVAWGPDRSTIPVPSGPVVQPLAAVLRF